MLGLKTQESSNFIVFFEKVQEEAKRRNKLFFLDCEDGNDAIVDGIEVCDLFGWLITEDQVETFVPKWQKDDVDDEWNNEYVSVTVKDSNGIKIIFDNSDYE